MPVLQSDSVLRLPSLTVLKASAGSGKTFALTERYVQFLLSPSIPRNDLACILAITFSNNASREMREKVLEWLKLLALGDTDRTAEILSVTQGGAVRAAARAGELLGEIFARWSDFQVRTIDSFLSMVYRASALDFGLGPDFEILLDPSPLLDYSFSLFLRGARAGTPGAELLDRTVRAVQGLKGEEDSWDWDPAPPLLAEVRAIDERLSRIEETPALTDSAPLLGAAGEEIRQALEEVQRLVHASGLEPNRRSTFPGLLAQARHGSFAAMIGKGMSTPPVRKPGAKDLAGRQAYERIEEAWHGAGQRVAAWAGLWARAWYEPYLRLHAEMAATLRAVKRSQGRIAIGDMGRDLAGYLDAEIVPDVYFRLGEKIVHFLVDEFQDTSPSQWRTLFPLVENSLATGGSLFVVGDTKQAIYGFRQADYTIMRGLEAASPFPSAGHVPLELAVNRRSRPRILELAAAVFRGAAAGSAEYGPAARASGLADWVQEPLAGDDPGYAEVRVLERNDEDPPERRVLHEALEQLRRRGYGWGDIAILASRNDEVLRATAWLNERSIPFLSFSSRDVRGRRAACEILALLAFLDSPTDDLAFATFILGDIFARASGTAARSMREFLLRCRNEAPLYKAFQREFPGPWGRLLAGLFRSAGYLPLYDLVSEAYAALHVFDAAPGEEAALAKLLEKVKEFEGSGSNSLREFLGSAAGETDVDSWAMDVPRGAACVQVMTVHKAKGLGFPVVIALLYGERNKGFQYPVLHEGGAARLVRLTRDTAAADPALERLYEEESTRQKVSRLNGLYVALTRARRELYVIGVKRDGDTFPFDLLPDAGFASAAGFAPGDPGPAAPAARPVEQAVELSHAVRPLPVDFPRGSLNREERRRGDIAHRMLCLAKEPGADLEAVLGDAADRAGAEARDESTGEGLADAAARMIRETELGGYFEPGPGRLVLAEQEYCDGEGRLFRMDRVIVDPDRVTVIDYKTGPNAEEEHVAEVEGYARILESAYPGRRVEAVLAYLDRCELRRVR